MKKQLNIQNLDEDFIGLLSDAKRREEKRSGYTITMQSFLRGILGKVVIEEKELQDIASEEYAKQQSEGAE